MWLNSLNSMKRQSGKTIEQISIEAGIPKGTLNKIFSGQTKDPQYSTLRAIVHCLGFTIDELEEKSPAPAEADTGDKRLDCIIENYHQLNEAGKDDLAKHAEHLTYIPEYKKGKMVHIKVQKSVARMQPGESYEDIPTVDEIAGTIVNSEEDL